MGVHVFSMLMEKEVGALRRVTGLIGKANFTINSLSIGETENPALSRMTVEMAGDERMLATFKKQLTKLVDVVKIEENPHCRELALLKISYSNQNQDYLQETINTFDGKIIKSSANCFEVAITGMHSHINDFIQAMKQFEVVELVRTGLTALSA